MFGSYRTLLALAVVAHHLLKVPAIGGHAVHGFFILSGYLMTTIMTKSYGYTFRGLAGFAANRFLRLFPTYWAVLCFIITTILLFGDKITRSYHSAIFLPTTAFAWFQNLTLLYADVFPMLAAPRFAPPTWALTVELLFYLLIAIGASRTRTTTMCWFVASVAYAVSTHVFELGFPYRYMHLLSGALPFSIGALIFHHQDAIKKMVRNHSTLPWIIGLFAAFTANSLVSALGQHVWKSETVCSICMYLNLPINFLLIAVLMNRPKLPFSSEVDKKIGDYSYPIYLCHWQAGLVSSMLLFGHPERGPNPAGLASFLAALVLCWLISFFTIHCIDKPVERIRSRIKSKIKIRTAQEPVVNTPHP